MDITISQNKLVPTKNSDSNYYSGNNFKYFPSGTPGGSDNPGDNSNNPVVEWETKASSPNPNQIISNIDFWNDYLNSNDSCPATDLEFDLEDEWEDEDITIVEIPDEILSQQRRKLFAVKGPPPTAKLDIPVQKKHNYSTYTIQPFEYFSKEGKHLTIKNWELKKIVYVHSDDLDILNFADKIMCPLQTGTGYQRTECRAITDFGKKKVLERILELTTSVDPAFQARKIPMPFYPSEQALIYIDTQTRAAVMFHANNGKLWSGEKLSELEMKAIFTNLNYTNLN